VVIAASSDISKQWNKQVLISASRISVVVYQQEVAAVKQGMASASAQGVTAAQGVAAAHGVTAARSVAECEQGLVSGKGWHQQGVDLSKDWS
jgi:hypothetical protein